MADSLVDLWLSDEDKAELNTPYISTLRPPKSCC